MSWDWWRTWTDKIYVSVGTAVKEQYLILAGYTFRTFSSDFASKRRGWPVMRDYTRQYKANLSKIDVSVL